MLPFTFLKYKLSIKNLLINLFRSKNHTNVERIFIYHQEVEEHLSLNQRTLNVRLNAIYGLELF